MNEQQRKVKALLMKIELLFDESVRQNVVFDEANEYGVIHEIVEVIRENNEVQPEKRAVLKVVPNEE